MVPQRFRLLLLWLAWHCAARPDESGTLSAPPLREVPAHLNCTAKRFIDTVLSGVTWQLELAGIRTAPQTSLSFHFDAGRSQPEGGGRAIPNVTVLNASKMDVNCSAEQVASCARAIGDLTSLAGLAEYLTDSLEKGVAQPTPDGVAPLGWGPVAQNTLDRHTHHAAGSEPMEFGGGSGAGFQVICDDKGLASLGGGGGGGAYGKFAKGSGKVGRPQSNESLGGGGGGGMQLAFPVDPKDDPWSASKWFSWSSGGGGGCGSCKPSDKRCLASPHGVQCGAKMDDKGAVNASLGKDAAHLWRVAVLRRCFLAGRLAVIGGGGGGGGGAKCCKGVPSLNFGFGFHARLMPGKEDSKKTPPGSSGTEKSSGGSSDAKKTIACCPDLKDWNVTTAGQSSSGTGVKVVAGRRLSAAAVVEAFAMENTGAPAAGGKNRRPELQEMIQQQSSRIGVLNYASLMLNLTAEECTMPKWLNASTTDAESPKAWHSSKSMVHDGEQTMEPESASKLIFKFNPLQGFLSEATKACGGWGDWCCVCHGAQRRIACQPQEVRSKVEWFLTEDCCESKMAKNHSSSAFVADATPNRTSTVAWVPGSGFRELPANSSDSYDWHPSSAAQPSCPMMVDVLLDKETKRIVEETKSRVVEESLLAAHVEAARAEAAQAEARMQPAVMTALGSDGERSTFNVLVGLPLLADHAPAQARGQPAAVTDLPSGDAKSSAATASTAINASVLASDVEGSSFMFFDKLPYVAVAVFIAAALVVRTVQFKRQKARTLLAESDGAQVSYQELLETAP